MTADRPSKTGPLLTPRNLMAGALAWGLAMAMSLLTSAFLLGLDMGHHSAALALLYGAGGFLGWLIALPVIQFASAGRAPSVVLSAWFVILGLATIVATSGLFALHYRFFYAHWHAPAFSRIWIYQQVFTSASAVYQFAVTGLRHFLPAGLVLLLALSIVMARRSR